MHAQQVARNSSQVHWAHKILSLTLLVNLCCYGTGCVSMAANMLYALRGNDNPAEYKGLEDKRVAVICSIEGALASQAASSLLTNYIGMILNEKLPKATIIGYEEIERRIEIDGWTGGDVSSLGKGVKADQVVMVKVNDLKLREGATLFRGQCDINVSVVDINADAKLVFSKQIPDHAFPQHGGVPITDTTEANFRNSYLQLVASRVASLFHPVDPTRDYALDATAGRM